MEWNDIYITGIKKIDEQHKELFDIIARLRNDFPENYIQERKEVKEILKFLIDYVIFHFSYEEKYLENIKYELLDEHKKIHNEFIKEIQSISKDFKTKTSYKPIKLYYFLSYWLQSHIAVEDKKVIEKVSRPIHLNKDAILEANIFSIELMFKNKIITNEERIEKIKKLNS